MRMTRRSTAGVIGASAFAVLLVAAALATPFVATAAKRRVAAERETATAIVGQTIRVGSANLFARAGGSVKVSWRVLSKPRGAKPTLGATHDGTRTFKTRRPGTYVLRERVAGSDGVFPSVVTVAVRPDDPPIGVSVQTLSDKREAAIWIGDKPVRDTYNRDGIFVDVLERTTRAEVEPGTVARDRDGIEKLMGIADKWSKAGDIAQGHLMIVSGPSGVYPNDVEPLDKLAQFLGATKFTEAERKRLSDGAPFSIVGIPGGAPDSAWVRIGEKGALATGDITGYLQYSQVIRRYDYVNPQRPTFDTQAQGRLAGRNVIRVGDKTYEATLPAGVSDGFQILALNRQTLDKIANVAVETNTAPAVNNQQNTVASALAEIGRTNPAPLVFIQSIGNPKALRKGWAIGANEIQKLGGTRLVFNAIDGQRHYALVGSSARPEGAIELSALTGDDRLVGGLARGHDMGFAPVAAGPPGGINPELMSMAYQPRVAFPALNTAEEKAAQTYLGKESTVCAADAHACDVRRVYYEDRVAQLATDEERMRAVTWPGPDKGLGRTAKVFDEVKAQLLKEIKAAHDDREYFDALADVFGKSAQSGRVKLDDITKSIYEDLKPPPSGVSHTSVLEVLSKIASLSGALPPPGGTLGKGVATALGIVAYLSRPSGGPLLADQFKTSADDLVNQFQQRMFSAESRLTDLSSLFVSDYGKLMDLAGKLRSPEWKLDPTAAALNDISLATRRWFAQTLLPQAYPWLIRGTPPPTGPGDANGLSCAPKSGVYQAHPWKKQPALAQIRATEGWEDNGTPIVPTFFFSKRGVDLGPGQPWILDDLSPSQQVAELMFGRVTEGDKGPLGLQRLEVLSPRVFGTLLRGNDTAKLCDLPQ